VGRGKYAGFFPREDMAFKGLSHDNFRVLSWYDREGTVKTGIRTFDILKVFQWLD
jgi:hypothetical protein